MLPTISIPGYTIEDQTGQGGMAKVYRAIQDSLGRPVALKIMNPVLADDPAFSKRFLDEGRLLASLQHPHIVTIYDIGVIDTFHYISMEYVDGGDLRERIRDGLSPNAALDHLLAVGSALKAAHDAQIVHRDVKPANMLFRRNGTLLLTDFGIAKQLASNKGLTMTGSMVGSPYYLSPEQALGHAIDGRADIYSLGIVLYEMLVGAKPFEGDSEIGIAMQHIEGRLPRLPQEQAIFQPLLDRMTAKHPNDRFSDMTALLHAAQSLRNNGIWLDTNIATSASESACTRDSAQLLTSNTTPAEKTMILATHQHQASASSDGQPPLAVNYHISHIRQHISRKRVILFAGIAGVLAIVGFLISRGLPEKKGNVGLVEPITPTVSISDQFPRPTSPIELEKQIDFDKTSEIERQKKVEQQVVLESQIESERQAELKRQRETEHQAELERQAELIQQAKQEPQAQMARQAEQDREVKIQALLRLAQVALSQYKLTTPANESAYYYYQKMLEHDPNNASAIEGFSKIADRYFVLGQSAINRQQYNKAQNYVTSGLRVKNDHTGLLELKKQLVYQDRQRKRPIKRLFQNVKRIFN
jgi:serine/threonine-protein kinase PpkA